MKRTSRPKLGQIVQAEFLDHAQDNKKAPMSVTVWGKITGLDEECLTVTCWQTANHDFETTEFTIVRSCIRGLYVLS